MSTRYETDVVAWANEQAALLRAGKFSALDIEHIADEVEDVGKSEKRELASRMAVLLSHLLKWQVLMGLSFQNHTLNPLQQGLHRRRLRQIDTQCQRVDKETDQSFNLQTTTVSARYANHNVFLPRVSA